MKKIIFVCTGNTCRSPMIMALVKQLHPHLLVDSAGIYACGEEISENSVKALKEEGIDLSGYISKPITQDLLDQADLIITATKEHKAMLKSFAKKKRRKELSLTAVSDEGSAPSTAPPFEKGGRKLSSL